MKRVGHDLPEELVEEILLWLPPNSLLRFKSVCKSWKSLISDQNFINKHLQVSINKAKNSSSSSSSSCLVLGWTRSEPLSLYEIFNPIDADGYEPDLGLKQVLSLVSTCEKDDIISAGDNLLPNTVVKEIYLPLIPDEEVEGEGFLMPIRGSHCNGIVCLVDPSPCSRERVVFYNPALREHKLIHTRRISGPDLIDEYCAHGFGYDSKANDYKFVRILMSSESNKAEVYTLGTDCWKEIQLDENFSTTNEVGVYLKGFLYWERYHTMLSFDLSEERFFSNPLPDQGPDMMLTKLAVWKESLVRFSFPASFHEREWYSMCYEMWVMVNNNGVAWTKHLSFGPLARVSSPLAFLNEEELLMESEDGRIVSYNLRAKTVRKLPIRGAILDGHSYADSYVGTLVSVKE